MNFKTKQVISGSLFALFLWLETSSAVRAQAESPHLYSPDGKLEFRLLLTESSQKTGENRLSCQVWFRGKALVDTSFLGLQIQDQTLLGANLKLTSSEMDSVDETYEVPAGKLKAIRNQYNTLREVGRCWPDWLRVLTSRSWQWLPPHRSTRPGVF